MTPSPIRMVRPCSCQMVGFRKSTRLPGGKLRSAMPQRSIWRQSNMGASPASGTSGMEAGASPRRTRRPSSAATFPEASMETSSPPRMPDPMSSWMRPKSGRRLAAETRSTGRFEVKSRPEASCRRLA